MIKDLPIKLDPVGRVVIPKNIRKMYNLENESLLFFNQQENEILFSKDTTKENQNKLLKKIHRLEKYNLEFIVTKDDKIIYQTSKENKFIPKIENTKEKYSIITDNKTKMSYYYVVTKANKYTDFIIFIKNEETKKETILTICNLL